MSDQEISCISSRLKLKRELVKTMMSKLEYGQFEKGSLDVVDYVLMKKKKFFSNMLCAWKTAIFRLNSSSFK